MKHKWMLATGLALTLVALGQKSDSPETLLGTGLHQEEVENNCKEAIRTYQKVIQLKNVAKSVAARAQLHIGNCQEKLGQLEAKSAYETVVKEFDAQSQYVAEAQARLRALSPPAPQEEVVRPSFPLLTGNFMLQATLSKDGRYLVSTIGVMDLSKDQRSIRVENSAGYYEHPIPSSDNRRVAYAFLAENANDSVYELRVSPLSGALQKGTTVFRNSEYDYSVPFAWSPDDKEIFALMRRIDGTSVIAAISSVPGVLGPPRIIRSLEWRWPLRLSLSPDGRYIAYDSQVSQSDPNNRDIFILATDGSNEAAIAPHPKNDALPLWTPDGRSVVFATNRSGTTDLWIQNVAAGKPVGSPRVLQADTGDIRPIGFTPSGSLVFVKEPVPGYDILTAEVEVSPKGENPVLKVPLAIPGFPGRNSSPSYSPDGTRLAYFSRRGIGTDLSIVVRTLNSGEEFEIPTLFTGQPGLGWFPDGNSVLTAAVSQGSGNRRILHKIDVKTGQELLPEKIVADSAASSRDGKRIYYLAGAYNGKDDPVLFAYEIETKRRVEVFKWPHGGTGGHHAAPLSPDGRSIAFSLPENQATPPMEGLYIVSTADGTSRKLDFPDGSLRVVTWTPDGKNLIVERQSTVGGVQFYANGGAPDPGKPFIETQAGFWTVPVDGGVASKTGPYPTGQLHSNGWQMVYTQETRGEAAVVWQDPGFLLRQNPPQIMPPNIFLSTVNPADGKVEGSASAVSENNTDGACSPLWSPDGKAIAFRRSKGRQGPFRNYVWIRYDIQTHEEREYSVNSGQCWMTGLWSHDGRSLLFEFNSRNDRTLKIARLDLTTGDAKELEIAISANSTLALSPDDKTLYMAFSNQGAMGTRLVSLDLATKQQKSIATIHLGDVLPFLAVSPNGRMLAMSISDAKSKYIVQIGVDGSGYKVLHSFTTTEETDAPMVKWTPDSRGILFAETGIGKQRLVRIALDRGGSPAPSGLEFLEFRFTGNPSFDLSPDGKHIAFTYEGVPLAPIK